MAKHRALLKGSIITILLWLAAGAATLSAQRFNFEGYNRSNGLLSNEVDCIAQNSSGFLFFGTPSGISLFDGTTFTNFDERKGFRQNGISDIRELPGNEMLLLTGSGRYYRLKNSKLQPDSFGVDDGLKQAYRTKEGSWILTGYKGIYDWQAGRVHQYDRLKRPEYPGFNCVIEWRDSLLIIGRSYEPLLIVNRRTQQQVASSVERLFVRQLFADGNGRVWIATIGNGVMLLDSSSIHGEHIRFGRLPKTFDAFATSEFRAIARDKEGNCWMASIGKGLIEYNSTTGRFAHFTTEQGLASNMLYAVFCDREDNIWIGSNRGAQKLTRKDVYSYSAAQGLPADLVLDVLPDANGNTITSGYSGMAYIPQGAVSARPWQPPLADEYVFSLLKQGDSYYGLSLRKLLRLSINNGRLSTQSIIDLPAHFRSMTPLGKDQLLLGGDSSILLVTPTGTKQLTKEGAWLVAAMAIDEDGFLWTGGLFNSIHRYRLTMENQDLKAKPIAEYHIPAAGPQDYIRCMAAGKGNRIIYGMTHSGLSLLEMKDGAIHPVKSIGQAEGLSSNFINAVNWLSDSVLLVCTRNGLDKLILSRDSNRIVIHNITLYYNIADAVYNIRQGKTGNYLLATEAGVYSIPSIDVDAEHPKPLPVVISAIHPIDNPDSFIDGRKPVTLAYNNSGLTISFSSPGFTSGRTVQYTHLLKSGNDTNWSPPSAAGTVTYAHLPPGEYSFLVKTVAPNGAAADSFAGFKMVVVPAFWQKGSFYIALIALVGTIFFFAIRRRIGTIRRESNLTTRVAQTEMMALRAQMNPHFIFNCMNIIDALITGNRNAEAADFLQKFSKVIRLVLENSQEQLVPLQKDLHALTLYTELEAIRFNHQFTYTFDVDRTLLEENIRIPPLLLQPYVENAIVHGLRNRDEPGGRLRVNIRKTAVGIEAVVEDNGIGRERAAALQAENGQLHEKMGMRLTGKRIAILQQANRGRLEIVITDIPIGTGTRVTIRLPADIKFD